MLFAQVLSSIKRAHGVLGNEHSPWFDTLSSRSSQSRLERPAGQLGLKNIVKVRVPFQAFVVNTDNLRVRSVRNVDLESIIQRVWTMTPSPGSQRENARASIAPARPGVMNKSSAVMGVVDANSFSKYRARALRRRNEPRGPVLYVRCSVGRIVNCEEGKDGELIAFLSFFCAKRKKVDSSLPAHGRNLQCPCVVECFRLDAGGYFD